MTNYPMNRPQQFGIGLVGGFQNEHLAYIRGYITPQKFDLDLHLPTVES